MTLKINDNFSKRVVINTNAQEWLASPMPNVYRKMLDRIGDEVARATTIVKYEPYSAFTSHTHSGGEEFFVLDGVFSDEHDDYPKGSYIRNPIGTMHTPKIGVEGATILVKLHQFEHDDNEQKFLQTNDMPWQPGKAVGVSVMPLHQYKTEHVKLVKWAPNTTSNGQKNWGGEEIYVIKGTYNDELGSYPEGTWIRNPHMSEHTPFTKEDGALIYVKTGHLPIHI